MYKTIDVSEFRDAFKNYGRQDNFSREGLEILFDFIEECDSGNTELDVIGLCCEFEEADLDEINEQYDQEFEDIEEAAEWLSDQTTVCGTTDDSVIFAQF